MMEFYEYKDAELSMRVPSYLRPKKGMRYFAARSKKDRHHPILHFAVEFLNDDLVKAHWASVMRMEPGAREESMGVRGHIVRRGKATYLVDGLELLGSSHNTVSGQTHHDYNVLFLSGSRRVYITFFGQGELDTFDRLCREIVNGIRIHE